MNRRPTLVIAAILAAVLLGLQFLSPVFRGEADLTLPERIRSIFVDLFGGEEEEEGEDETEEAPFVELENQPQEGTELPMQTQGEMEEVDLPEEGGVPLTETGEENELPLDVFR